MPDTAETFTAHKIAVCFRLFLSPLIGILGLVLTYKLDIYHLCIKVCKTTCVTLYISFPCCGILEKHIEVTNSQNQLLRGEPTILYQNL